MADQRSPIPIPASAIPAPSAVDENDDEININLKIKTVVPFKVKRSEKMKKLKQLCLKEGISENLIDFYCRDESLNVEQTFEENNVSKNSTVKLVLDTLSVFARRLSIRVPSNPDLNTSIVANVNDTMQSIKTMISTKLGINPCSYDLMYDSKVLESTATLANLDVETEAHHQDEISTLYLIKRSPEQDLVWLSVYTPTRGVIALQFNKLQNVGYAKAVVGSVTNTDVERAALLLGGLALSDNRTIASYSIEDHTFLLLTNPFQVYVKLYRDRAIPVMVLSSDDVYDVLERVYDKLQLDFRVHPITFDGRRLQPGHSIVSYGVKEDSFLNMGRPTN